MSNTKLYKYEKYEFVGNEITNYSEANISAETTAEELLDKYFIKYYQIENVKFIEKHTIVVEISIEVSIKN